MRRLLAAWVRAFFLRLLILMACLTIIANWHGELGTVDTVALESGPELQASQRPSRPEGSLAAIEPAVGVTGHARAGQVAVDSSQADKGLQTAKEEMRNAAPAEQTGAVDSARAPALASSQPRSILPVTARAESDVSPEHFRASQASMSSYDLAGRYSSTGKQPRPLLANPTLKYLPGQPLSLEWNVDLADFGYYITPSAFTRSWVDQRDPTVTHVELLDYEQGQTYDLYVTEAVSSDGARLRQVHRFRIETSPPLEVSDQWPEQDSVGIGLNSNPSVTFSDSVADRAMAERAITVDPPRRLAFTWMADNQVEVSPVGGWPFSTEVSLIVAGGPDGVVGQSGGYLAQSYRVQFLTRPNKTIDVDLTKQIVTLYEGEEAVYTTLTATGVRGAETPTGEFTVLYKLEKTRMRGQNPSGRRYDIPDVPWVLAFWGDYTVHGAPWRQAFGIPQSNGCVSLPTPAAKHVYDWSPVGTLIRIHY